MKNIKKYGMIIVGCLLIAMTINLFFVGTDLIPPGIYGLAILYDKSFTMNLPIILALLNLFCFGGAYLFVKPKDLKRFVLSFILIPLFVLITREIKTIIDLSSVDMLLMSIYGGALLGLGTSLIYKEEAFASADDVIMKITRRVNSRYRYIVNYIIDAILIIIAIFTSGLEMAMYTMISIVIAEFIKYRSKLGISDAKVFYIITKKEKEITDYIMNELGCDLTIFDVKGGYLKTKNRVLMSAIPTKDYYRLREGVKAIDPNAFISITDSYEVINKNKTYEKVKNNIKD